ncbi:MAG: transcriptional regulator, partial [Anaerolineae bacterium]|nr:transcriptional regulator [Anaerolineae bacterium]
MTSRKSDRAHWYRVDLHIHTPASADYQQPTFSYLDILQRAELRGIDILAFTDHNTVAGYATMRRTIEQLEFLAARGQATPDEQRTLAEYRRLLDKILVLPGFEFTATFGFHVLGIFHPNTPIRRLEHLLLNLRLPFEAIESGLTEVGASADVLTAYRAIREAGGICIAAHVNAAHGVAMRN